MIKYISILFVLCLSMATYGQSILGHWETFDDKTKEKKAVIEIYQTGELYFAKIIKTYSGERNAICENCEGDKKNKPIIGLIIIENMKQDDAEYNEGIITDPENGKSYKCDISLVHENKLKVRGYLGLSLFGRTQYWSRKK